MTSISTSTPAADAAPATPTTSVRAGLALSAFVGLANIPALAPGVDWGSTEPPKAALLLAAAIGMVSVVCAALAWNTGNRRAIRINAAALIVNAVMVVPGLFMGLPPVMTVVSALFILLPMVAVVLTMRRKSAPLVVSD